MILSELFRIKVLFASAFLFRFFLLNYVPHVTVWLTLCRFTCYDKHLQWRYKCQHTDIRQLVQSVWNSGNLGELNQMLFDYRAGTSLHEYHRVSFAFVSFAQYGTHQRLPVGFLSLPTSWGPLATSIYHDIQ